MLRMNGQPGRGLGYWVTQQAVHQFLKQSDIRQSTLSGSDDNDAAVELFGDCFDHFSDENRTVV